LRRRIRSGIEASRRPRFDRYADEKTLGYYSRTMLSSARVLLCVLA
jgi:hypothetical protein